MLTITSVPIGNLADLSPRAREALMNCDEIICEDTRVTGKLLELSNLPKKTLTRLPVPVLEAKIQPILERLQQGVNMCLVCDAGTPGISDPGTILIRAAARANILITVIPGPAAFLAALSGSGLPAHRFWYLGFLPMKKGRQTKLKEIADCEDTVLFYESVHRIRKTMLELSEVLKDYPNRPIVIAREVTKYYESFIRLTVAELKKASQEITEKGEFVLIVGGKDVY